MQLSFSYWTDRWGANTTVHLTHMPSGWNLSAAAHSGNCNKAGVPNLYSNFEQDNVEYPRKMKAFLEHAWQEIHDGVWAADEAQQRIQELADWVTACERAEPQWKGWN